MSPSVVSRHTSTLNGPVALHNLHPHISRPCSSDEEEGRRLRLLKICASSAASPFPDPGGSRRSGRFTKHTQPSFVFVQKSCDSSAVAELMESSPPPGTAKLKTSKRSLIKEKPQRSPLSRVNIRLELIVGGVFEPPGERL